MLTRNGLAIGAAALALAATSGFADDARIIRGNEQRIEVKRVEVPLHAHNTKRLTKVVTWQAEDRIITAAKSRAMMGHERQIIHVEVVHENVYLHSDRDYIRQNEFRVNENDLIPAAHRLARSLAAEPARVIWGSPTEPAAGQVSVEPLFILDKPEGLKRAPGTPAIPNVPQPPEKRVRPLVAQAQ